ncbi:oxidoreductase [Enemella evansiae]|uniref:NAD-dependent epimerase/dehydratase family protein n=1 Tax=Enemella evansiae TaxID=2016499 RepID=UPI000B96637D|nr:NAD-dependent epimerase/dehydratase family protein [Enemella evansiae]OYO11151.1 oxidoreductase [Enemella evansiae]
MDILVLGGTAFLGRMIAEEALARGHAVTCLARGSTEPPRGSRFVRADRDEPDGLAGVRDQVWDAVIDVTGQPGQARRAATELTTRHRVFVSSANVYAELGGLDQPEDAPLRPPLTEDTMASMEQYGEAKVACENAYLATDSAIIVRAGLIGGPGDWSARSGYWPWRFAHPSGPDVVVPDDPQAPCALIDVRDLAAWLVHCAEHRISGIRNATGPTITLAELLDTAAEVAGSTLPRLRVPPDRLGELGLRAWMGPASFPLWVDDPALRGFSTLDSNRAIGDGLKPRPLAATLAAVLAYENGRDPADRPAGLTDADEQRVRGVLG